MLLLVTTIFLLDATSSSAAGLDGYPAQKGVLPYVVALLEKNQNNQHAHFCCGSILEASWIVTAARCLDRKNVENIFVVPGVVDLSKITDAPLPLSAIFLHPNYRLKTYPRNNIALAKLERPFDFSNYGIEPICVGDVGFGELVEISGWKGAILSYSYLNTTRKCPDNNNFVCGVRENKDVCILDAGGPLISLNTRRLVGVNLGAQCRRNEPQVFTRIEKYKGWIENVIKAN